MSRSTATEYILSARKAHQCSWCAEQIDTGSSYRRWRYFSSEGATTCKLHVECFTAMEKYMFETDEYEWTMHAFDRGCY